MSVFDNVNFEVTCPNCKKPLTGFQSKSGNPSGRSLEFWQVDEFHATCWHCRTWIEYNLKPDGVQKRSIAEYDVNHFPLSSPITPDRYTFTGDFSRLPNDSR